MTSVPQMKRAIGPAKVYARGEIEAISTAPGQSRSRPMTPLRAKYLRDLVIRGLRINDRRSQKPYEATLRKATRWRSVFFEQQAKAIGCMFSIAANFTDPGPYFVGGGIVGLNPIFAIGAWTLFARPPSCATNSARSSSSR